MTTADWQDIDRRVSRLFEMIGALEYRIAQLEGEAEGHAEPPRHQPTGEPVVVGPWPGSSTKAPKRRRKGSESGKVTT